jgi:hypothetical protein
VTAVVGVHGVGNDRSHQTGHAGEVMAMASTMLGGHPVAVTAGIDCTVRVWDLGTGAPVGRPAFLPESGRAIQITGTGDILVGFGWDVAVLRCPLDTRSAL